MPYELKIDEAHGIVEIRFHGATPHGEHVSARDEILEICRSRGIDKVLVDVRELEIREEPSMMDLFDFGASWPAKRKDTRIFLAGVFPRDAHTRGELIFGDTVAFNRGFYTRGFQDVEEARLWLRQGAR
jgi:hypothetical protein